MISEEKFDQVFSEVWDKCSTASYNEKFAKLINDQIEETHPELTESEKKILHLANYNTGFALTFQKELLKTLLVNDFD